MTLKVRGGQIHEWKKNALYCRVTKQCKRKRVWDWEFETFTFHAHLWEWVLLLCVVWWWEACVHVSIVVVVHRNSEWNRNGWRCLWVPWLGVFIQELWLWFSVCVPIPLLSLGAPREGQWPDQGLWLATNPWCLSSITRCCGDTLHDKGTKHRVAPNVKPCKILALETSAKKVMFPLLRRSPLKISFPFLSLFPPRCCYIRLHRHFGQAFLGLYILQIKGLLRKLPMHFDLLPLYFLESLEVWGCFLKESS